MKFNKKLIKKCIDNNKFLIAKGLVIQNFGNASIKIDSDYFAIKPSGVDLNKLKENDVPLISISDGKVVNGKLKPSVDTNIHLQIYKNFKDINNVSHTHSKFASSWAQSGKNIPNLGTTHSDYSLYEIKNLEYLNKFKTLKDYEKNLGNQIVKYIKKLKNPFFTPGVLLSGHGVFSWGKNFTDSIINSEIIEYLAEMALYTTIIKSKRKLPKYLIEKHFFRKNGINSYYGQGKNRLKE